MTNLSSIVMLALYICYSYDFGNPYKLGHLSQFQHHDVYVDDAFVHGNPKFPHCNINSIHDKHRESSLDD